VICHSLPRTGLPRAFRDWDDYAATVEELSRAAEIRDGASLWWDMRPHHSYDTLEIRTLDAQSSLGEVATLTALVHCLVTHEALTASGHDPAPELLAEATFRALRDGLDATFSVGGPLVAVRDLARHAHDIASGYAPTLGCVAELDDLERLLCEGNGAIRQRRAFREAGMPAVFSLLRRETDASPMTGSA
jgi:carboxylate-amine ligase